MSDTLNLILAVQSAGAVRDLNKAKAATNQVTDSINKASNAAKRMDGQFNRTAVAMNKFGKGVAQQAGYQIADFAVQVSNGTSAIQAFGQQGSQMLAIFGPVGSILGAVVAIAAAVGVAFEKGGLQALGFGQRNIDLKKTFEDLNSQISTLGSTLDTSTKKSVEEVAKMFGTLDKSIFNAYASLRQFAETEQRLNFARAMRDFADGTKQVDKLADNLENLSSVFRMAGGNTAALDRRLKELGISSQEELKKAQESIVKFNQGIIAGIRFGAGEGIEQLKKQIEIFTELLSDESAPTMAVVGEIKPEIRESLKAAVQLYYQLSGVARETYETLVTTNKNANDEADKQNKLLDKNTASYQKILTSIKSQIEQLELKNRLFGQSSTLLEDELRIMAEVQKLIDSGVKLSMAEVDGIYAQVEAMNELLARLREKGEIAKSQQEMEKEVAKAREATNKQMEQDQRRINDLMRDGFKTAGDTIAGLINKTSSWRDALGAVLKKVIEIVAQMGATKSGGFSFSKLFSSFAMSFAGGGYPTTAPQAGPMVGGHQTFHNGGMIGRNSGIGFRSDERMIVARTGERVLNRGQAIMSQQGGDGGAIVINQTINLSTGVQQTVRAEVMSMAPQIAAQAKAAVLDAKRRGGGFSAAFA